jgi:hypothetical protein
LGWAAGHEDGGTRRNRYLLVTDHTRGRYSVLQGDRGWHSRPRGWSMNLLNLLVGKVWYAKSRSKKLAA